ncbi:hypothetical protein [Streptomyces sp. NPDC101455]|uniref:hypothetical protein n=1 Tax=Streptomyces sp. NPDC101455 TaxID=3366142 RepID=UPI0037F6AF09
MPLIDSIRVYQLLIKNDVMDLNDAVLSLVRASSGTLGTSRARTWLEKTDDELHDAEQILFDVVDLLRAVENGRARPTFLREGIRRSARRNAWRMLRAPLLHDDESSASRGTP